MVASGARQSSWLSANTRHGSRGRFMRMKILSTVRGSGGIGGVSPLAMRSKIRRARCRSFARRACQRSKWASHMGASANAKRRHRGGSVVMYCVSLVECEVKRCPRGGRCHHRVGARLDPRKGMKIESLNWRPWCFRDIPSIACAGLRAPWRRRTVNDTGRRLAHR